MRRLREGKGASVYGESDGGGAEKTLPFMCAAGPLLAPTRLTCPTKTALDAPQASTALRELIDCLQRVQRGSRKPR